MTPLVTLSVPGLTRMARYGKVVLGPFRLTFRGHGHGGGIASQEDWLVCECPSNAIADCPRPPNGETQCHDRMMCKSQDMRGEK